MRSNEPIRFSVMLYLVLGGVSLEVQASTTVLVVVGAEGTPEYGRQFIAWGDRWEQAAKQCGARFLAVGRGPKGEVEDRDRLLQILEAEPKEGLEEFWLVLIGHGTFDGRVARFNLRGSDISDSELAKSLAAFQRPTAIINCASCSGPFINKLSGPGRVVVTAVRSGSEQNFARFGDYLSAAISDSTADFDKDGQTTLLEAFLAAARGVAEFYRTEARLATEHGLIDDNGDGLGTPADWFRGIRAIKRAKDGTSHDGYRAHQFVLIRSDRERRIPQEFLRQRNDLELAIAKLRETKATMPEDEYYRQLEILLLQLARLNEQVMQCDGL